MNLHHGFRHPEPSQVEPVMKVLICGTGRIARELISRLGEAWELTIIEKFEEQLTRVVNLYPYIKKAHHGDASSPVVLQEAGLADHDYVLALTSNDPVNLAIVSAAREKGIPHILSLVDDPANNLKFLELDVKTVLVNTAVAKSIYHYLEDPRLLIAPLALGLGEVIELDVTPQMQFTGRTVASLNQPDWSVAAIFRDRKLIFPHPKTRVKLKDRLVIVGRSDSFRLVYDLLERSVPYFPLAYGRTLLLNLPPKSDADPLRLMSECAYLVQNTRVKDITVLCNPGNEDLQDLLTRQFQEVDITFDSAEEQVWEQMYEFLAVESIGLVVVPPFETSFWRSLGRSGLMALAKSMACPLLVARNSDPYEKILVPFNASPKSEMALEAAVDLSKQLNGTVTVVIVREPDFMHGAPTEDWLEEINTRVRNLSHIQKTNIEITVRQGNPVKEIVKIAKDYDLMVMGTTTREPGFLSPHVGELLAGRSPCSVMVVNA